MSSIETTMEQTPSDSRVWRAVTAVGAVLIAVAILGVMQLKYSQSQELH